jgi:hypothetical protein
VGFPSYVAWPRAAFPASSFSVTNDAYPCLIGRDRRHAAGSPLIALPHTDMLQDSIRARSQSAHVLRDERL